MIIDNITQNSIYNEITFLQPGEHIVYVLIKNLLDEGISDLSHAFKNVTKMISISFTENFETKNINYMNYFFINCTSLISIDLSHINTENVFEVEHMFRNCTSLTTINFSNFNTENIKSMSHMFYN